MPQPGCLAPLDAIHLPDYQDSANAGVSSEPITWLIIAWATYSPHRTTASLEKVPQANMQQCQANDDLVAAWQPKASVKCI